MKTFLDRVCGSKFRYVDRYLPQVQCNNWMLGSCTTTNDHKMCTSRLELSETKHTSGVNVKFA